MHEKISDNNRIPAVVLNMGIPGLAINRSLKRKKDSNNYDRLCIK